MRAAYRTCASFRQTKMPHLALCNQVADGTSNVFDGHRRVYAVLIKQVDIIGTQALQRGIADSADVFRAAVHAGHLAVLQLETKLGRDDHLLAQRLQGLTQQQLVGIGPIDLGCIEERNTTLHGGAQQFDHRLLIWRRPITMAHPHAAQTQCRHLQPTAAQHSCLHGPVSQRIGHCLMAFLAATVAETHRCACR